MEDLISEKDYQRSLLKGGEGWEGGGGAQRARVDLYIRNKKANINKLHEFSKYLCNLLVTWLDVSMAIRLS